MSEIVRIARLYDAYPVTAASASEVIRCGERLHRRLRRGTTRTWRWWPWGRVPTLSEAERVRAACEQHSAAAGFDAQQATLLRLILFHSLYGAPVADQLHQEMGFMPEPHAAPHDTRRRRGRTTLIMQALRREEAKQREAVQPLADLARDERERAA